MSDIRYPIGRFTPPANIDTDFRRTAIAAIADAPRELKSVLSRLTDTQIDTPYREGGWTVRQLVHHLADSHMNGYIRFKLALTEHEPTIKTYDQNLWGDNLEARTASVESSLALLAGLHVRWAAMLEAMDEAAWHRRLVHPESGVLDLNVMLALYAWHGRHHAAHIAALRERNGW